ncbi:hypothetical protein B0T10DRAFT_483682 [Thelonectria olida]|uniref:Uncharacterized protein n=1 Tax=Thelonectria olida TaxID=1576542 RepID=A0A9P9AU90_9HYPO|nr:hypothetical protein B0T10DRAFT_483682 [Thelonectria olida]
MKDAIRPDAQAVRAMYERGYRTWFNLSKLASAVQRLPRLQVAFPNHPHFPENLQIDRSFRNVALAKGKSTWATTRDLDHLPAFQHEAIFEVAWDKPTPVIFTSDLQRALPNIFRAEENHIPILMLAWAYILSARWAELIQATHLSPSDRYQTHQSTTKNDKPSITVYVGEINEDAARWWNTILSGSWEATMRSSKGTFFILLAIVKPTSFAPSPTTSTTAYLYLSEYCRLHDIEDQKQAALSAALLIPVAKYDHKPIELVMPKLSRQVNRAHSKSPIMKENKAQIDRLLTLSCNPRGLKALLSSVFFDPDVTSNICGIWLRGSFAFLNTIKDPHILLRTLIQRDPELGGLWVGAFITGAHHQCLRDGRAAWWKIDLNAAAWTDTFVSFIQEPVPAPEACSISRADECRLLYLCHDKNYANPPLYPFAPFGSTALVDTNLDVREHALCGRNHCLQYAGFTWVCQGGTTSEQSKHDITPLLTTIRPKHGQSSHYDVNIDIDYNEDDSDDEDESSEMVTHNIFTWLRSNDGFPVAERAIREHEWIDNLNDDDDAPIRGGALHGWILRTSTQRSNSI